MELRTYTGLWATEKKIYRFYDVNLPMPVSARQIGILLGSAIPWIALLAFIGVPFEPPLPYLLYLAPPVLLTWWSNRPVAEGKGLVDFVRSQIMFLASPRTYAALTPIPEQARPVRLTGTTWSAKSDD